MRQRQFIAVVPFARTQAASELMTPRCAPTGVQTVEPDISSVNKKKSYFPLQNASSLKQNSPLIMLATSPPPLLLHICHLRLWELNEWDTESALKGKQWGYRHKSVRTSSVLFSSFLCFSCIQWITTHYVFSLAALNSLITFSYTTNVSEAAGRFFSRLDVMPL